MTPAVISVQPLNVVGVAFVFQVMFAIILFTTGHMAQVNGNLRSNEKKHEDGPILLLTLVAFVILVLSEEFYSIIQPMFNGASLNTLRTSTAIFSVLLLDTMLVCYLVVKTNGSHKSPFTSAFFIIPAIAIFLRMSPTVFWALTFATIVMYVIGASLVSESRTNESFSSEKAARSATVFMNISCLLLSMITGYITRPASVGELKGNAHTSIESPLTSK